MRGHRLAGGKCRLASHHIALDIIDQCHKLLVRGAAHHLGAPGGGMGHAFEIPARICAGTRHERQELMRQGQVLTQRVQALNGTAHRHRRVIERKGTRIAKHPRIAVDTTRDKHRAGARAVQMLSRVLGREHIARTDYGYLDGVGHLMCGLPGQTAASWRRTLDGVLAAAPHHVSVYPLTLEEGTPLFRMACRDASLEPDEDFQAACMDVSRDCLSAVGYHPYEVASYALDGHECAHNIAYWTGQGYLGLGRSAAGMLDAEDFDRLAELFPGVSPRGDAHRVRLVQRDDTATSFEAEYLSRREAAAEDLMLACRMTRGVGSDLLMRAARDIPTGELASACDRALELDLATLVSESGDPRSGIVTSSDVIAGRIRARLAPTRLGWLDGNVLFELFWGLA